MARAYIDWKRLQHLPYRDAWVLRVAANVAVDQLRSTRRTGELPDEGVSIGEQLESVELRATLVPLLRALPKRQRETLVLTYIVGLPRRDIAALLGTSESSVKTHLARALAHLRSQLASDSRGASNA